MDNMLFNDAARGLMIIVTAYSLTTGWWTSNLLLYEYGVNKKV